MYVYIAIAAYFVVLFLTLRDIRIYRRTSFESYRKGAMKGIAASTIVLIGAVITPLNPNIGLLFVLIGMFLNKKGAREKVFNDANATERMLGETDLQQ
ncbi:hypothetical protein [Methanohalophilus profundi]|uniref:hypothetical protein n=1 Tax=Methanohalophilus profundi TaxID=2138083 RepID=UPI00101DDE13|nr:hypothetical protein [Methanohalophilus profundi]